MILFAGFIFPDEKACLICEHVYNRESDPGIIVHDHDGWLQILCGKKNHVPEMSKIVALSEVIGRLPAEQELPKIDMGDYAEKTSNGLWRSSKIEDA